MEGNEGGVTTSRSLIQSNVIPAVELLLYATIFTTPAPFSLFIFNLQPLDGSILPVFQSNAHSLLETVTLCVAIVGEVMVVNGGERYMQGKSNT